MLVCLLFFLMIRLPPRSTLTDTLFPYTTLFRSVWFCDILRGGLGHLESRQAILLRQSYVDYWNWRNCSSCFRLQRIQRRSEEHTSELQSLMRISYAVFCLKKKNKQI